MAKKQVKVVKKQTAMLCPHCGHDDFRKKREGFFMFGQQFECAKCKGVFKKANVVKVKQTDVKIKRGR
jgi:transposase-like protein